MCSSTSFPGCGVVRFGKPGRFFYKIVRGNDDRPVQPHRETKSVGAENTFPYDLTTLEEMDPELDKIADIIYDRLKRTGLKARTITLKIKYHDFKQATLSQSFPEPIEDIETILRTAKELLASNQPGGAKKIRLLGISLSNFGDNRVKEKKQQDVPDQLKLF